MKLPSEIVAATGNLNKLRELQTVADEFGCRILSPKEIQAARNLSAPPEVEEDALTFHENARLKAYAYQKWSGCAAIGDDSGIEVTALDGRPGVHSARYAGPGASELDRIQKLLRELSETQRQHPEKDRSAQFHCALALVLEDGTLVESEGILRGHILHELRGTKGFGYDPILYLDDIGSTLAEIDFEVTCKKGFRAVAARKLFRQFSQA